MQVVFVQVSESVPNQMRNVLIHKKNKCWNDFLAGIFFSRKMHIQLPAFWFILILLDQRDLNLM